MPRSDLAMKCCALFGAYVFPVIRPICRRLTHNAFMTFDSFDYAMDMIGLFDIICVSRECIWISIFILHDSKIDLPSFKYTDEHHHDMKGRQKFYMNSQIIHILT
jgi:hypothetical protein